jgi:hypothetical protein
MVKLGIVLIVASLVALPVTLVSAAFGLFGVADVASWIYVLSPLLLATGVVLVVLGTRRRKSSRGA